MQKTKQEASPPTTTSNTSHMLASERGKTYTAPAETSAAQVESSTAQVSLRNSGGLAVQRGRGDSSSSCSVYNVLTAFSVSLQAFIEAQHN